MHVVVGEIAVGAVAVRSAADFYAAVWFLYFRQTTNTVHIDIPPP